MLKKILGAALLAVVTVLALAAPSVADTLHLKDGRVLEGRVSSEGDGFVYFVIKVGSIEHTELFARDQIEKIERSEAPSNAATTGNKGNQQQARTVSPGATKVAFISLREMVGPFMNAAALKKSVEIASKDEPDIIVLVINSGGGALIEVEPLSDAIHNDLKKDYRVVAWIESAISAAAMTAFNCEEMYMTSQGNIGAAVAFTQEGQGQTRSLQGADLEEVLMIGEKLSKRGKRNPLIMRAMQVFMDLSCDIDENGIITWRDDAKGEYVVNRKERILTLNSLDAVKYGVAKGIADSKDELLSAMGVTEWVEVGQKGEEYQQQFRRNVATVQTRANELLSKYSLALQAAGGGDPDTRNRFIGRARNYLRELQSLVRQAPSVELYMGLTPEWFREREEELRRLAQGNT